MNNKRNQSIVLNYNDSGQPKLFSLCNNLIFQENSKNYHITSKIGHLILSSSAGVIKISGSLNAGNTTISGALNFSGSSVVLNSANTTISGALNFSGSMSLTGNLQIKDKLWVNENGISTGHMALELNELGSGNRYAYIDFHGDDTYTDYRITNNKK